MRCNDAQLTLSYLHTLPSIYVHIPFCETKCIYCDFYSIESRDSQELFVEALVTEIVSRAKRIDYASPFDSLFFGGGTPSLLTPPQLEKITDALRMGFTFSPNVEFTLECNPGTVNGEKLRAYKSIGVNRLSFGVQSFHEEDLLFLTRIHSVDQAIDAIHLAHEAGFQNVNLDLMFSLPQQTKEKWLYNLMRARELDTTHISCYSLTVEEGTPLAGMVKAGAIRKASEESDAELYEATMTTLASWGYRQYEVSNFARQGCECRHNLSYWRHEEYLGFGPSAHSHWNGERLWNVSSLKSYLTQIVDANTAIAGKEILTSEMMRSEYIFLRLRSEGIDLREYERRFHSDMLIDNEPHIGQYQKLGVIKIENGILSLTQKGMLVCDEICSMLK